MPDIEQLSALRIRNLWAYLLSVESWGSERPYSARYLQEKFYLQLQKAAEWPPNVFCLVAAVLKHSGAYTWLLSVSMTEWQEDAKARGSQWQKEIGSPAPLQHRPQTLEVYGKLITASAEYPSPFYSRRYYAGMPDVMESLARLLMQADYACEGFGFPWLPKGSSLAVQDEANFLLDPREFGSTLCQAIHPTKARVLPKAHTPPSGRTLRSLSHNLCYVESDEGRPLWHILPNCVAPENQINNRVNILLVPHPHTISGRCFQDQGARGAAAGYRGELNPPSLFVFRPADTCGRAAREVCNLVERAEQMGAPVHVVILPETSLCVADYRLLRNYLLARKITLIVGLGGTTEEGMDENRLCINVPVSATHSVHIRQKKHHPWRIHREQILQYELANELDPSRTYWENLRVGDRNTYFVVLRSQILASILVCEDLAQYEPVGRLIRAVGPHLVIALLLDGPQIGRRWPERYAAVLTDDPGCSVLSLTCAGMSRRSQPVAPMPDRKGVVALWRDPSGRREIELKPESSGLVLTLTIEEQEEWTADGRSRTAVSLHFAQCLQVPSDSPGTAEASWFDERSPQPDIKYLAPVEASALVRFARLLAASPKDDSALAYGKIFARLGREGRKLARQMLRRRLNDSYGPLEQPGLEQMGPEEKRQADILARCGVNWRESPKGLTEESLTADEIAMWAESLRNLK